MAAPTQEGVQGTGSRAVNSLLHGYMSGLSLSSAPKILCDTGKVISICFLSCPVILCNSQKSKKNMHGVF